MRYGIGTICYILDDENHVLKGRISGFAGGDYMVQAIGICGAHKVPESGIYDSEEAAASNKKSLPPEIKVQISE